MLKEVETQFRATLPHQDGILLRPALVTHTAKKVSWKYKRLHQRSLRYSSLPSHSKARQRKRDWRFRNRVGGKADRLKKVQSLTAVNNLDILPYCRFQRNSWRQRSRLSNRQKHQFYNLNVQSSYKSQLTHRPQQQTQKVQTS